MTVITKNEQVNLPRALESVQWADEIVVVDCGSTDETVAIASRYTSRVIVRGWPGYVAQKNYAAEAATHDWVLSLDADERVTSGLADEIRRILATEPVVAGYRIPRVTRYLGRWIRTTDWYPDYQLRLYDRRRGRWQGRHVHESVSVDGTIALLTGELEHHAYRDTAHHLEKMNAYAALAAKSLDEQQRKSSAFELVVHAPVAFFRNYILRGGFRDGTPGLIVSTLNAFYVFLKFARLWEIQHPDTHDAGVGADTDSPS